MGPRELVHLLDRLFQIAGRARHPAPPRRGKHGPRPPEAEAPLKAAPTETPKGPGGERTASYLISLATRRAAVHRS